MTMRRFGLLCLLAFAGCFFFACEDPYPMNDKEPNYSGGYTNIYDYLKNSGKFNEFIKVIAKVDEDSVEQTKYSDILRTSSKTLFVPTDAAFKNFYQSNEYGIARFEDFTTAQCQAILLAGMIENANTVEMLTQAPETRQQGVVMRRVSNLPVLYSIPFEQGDQLPQSSMWDRFKEKGIHVLSDNTKYTLVHFLYAQAVANNITTDDFYWMTNKEWDWSKPKKDAFLFDVKISDPDIVCVNGYVHGLEEVLLPRDNMAEFIRKNPKTTMFNKFLERYSMPLPDMSLTSQYKNLHPEFTDTIWFKWFYNTDNDISASYSRYLPAVMPSALKFSPAENNYGGTALLKSDMAAIFVPTDDALRAYFDSGAGSFLKERYLAWDSVPDQVMATLLNHHMKPSYLASVPSKFGKIEDNMGVKMGAKTEDIVESFVGSNGLVYVTNKVYSPTEYATVVAPVLTGAKTTIFNWGISQLRFNLYLMSMEEGNRFSFFVPTDDALIDAASAYIDPISVSRGKPERLMFRQDNNKTLRVSRYDFETGDSVLAAPYTQAWSETPYSQTAPAIAGYFLQDLMDNCIILEDIVPGKHYYKTKGGGFVYVDGEGLNMKLRACGDVARITDVIQPASAMPDGQVIKSYAMENGTTYLVDHVVQQPMQSLYSLLASRPEFSMFFDLCSNIRTMNDEYGKECGGYIFGNNGLGIDFNATLFKAYNYTVYAPDNDAIQEAISKGWIKSWEDIEDLYENDEINAAAAATQVLYDFLTFHFQTNTVFIDEVWSSPATYDTGSVEWLSTSDPTKPRPRYRQLQLTSDGTGMAIKAIDTGETVNVDTSSPDKYNLVVRDYLLRSGTTNDNTTNAHISASSFAVVHTINHCLRYKK